MITRNVLNHENEIIGTMDFPDGTSEGDIQEKLAAYAAPVVREIKPVTPRQIRQALILSGIPLSEIDSAFAAFPEPTKSLAQVEWEYSTLFIRTNPLVATVGQLLGWTSEQLDQLWLMAGSL